MVSQTLNYQHCRQEESAGMVMLFTLVTAMQEKLSERADQIKTIRDEKQQKEAEAAGKQLFHDIPDTIENFLS